MNKILKLLALDIEYRDDISYRRIMLISSISALTTLVFIIFTFVNAFFLDNYTIALFDLAASVVSFMAIFNLRQYKNIPLAAKLATINMMLFVLALAYVNGSSHFSLIWTIFLPIFAILANGTKIGLYFSLLFYTLLLSIAYINIGVWESGVWLLQDWLRLGFSSLVLTFIMYMNEKTLEASSKKLSEVRELESLYMDEQRKHAITDQLTTLYNRRYYNEMVPKLLQIAKRKELYITFFILDIDYFKNYNDHYGHVKGDEALVAVAKAIKNHIQRGDDFVFRLGGEEFAGIILSRDYKKTHEWVMETCHIIEKLHIEHAESKVSQYITASIGISTICYDQEYSMDKLYSIADEALYTAKNNGRNRGELSLQCA